MEGAHITQAAFGRNLAVATISKAAAANSRRTGGTAVVADPWVVGASADTVEDRWTSGKSPAPLHTCWSPPRGRDQPSRFVHPSPDREGKVWTQNVASLEASAPRLQG